MLGELSVRFPIVASTFAEASEAARIDLWTLAQQGPEAQLNRTANTQPALLAASIAVWRVWRSVAGPAPVVLTGHSLGEYAALTAADALSFADAVRLVRHRGELMQLAVPEGEGAMAAILGVDDEVIAECCRASSSLGLVSPAIYNSPGQVVIGGAAAAVDDAIERCKAAGAKRAMRVAMSVPSHCPLMARAANQLAETLRDVSIHAPTIPVLHNVDAASAATPDAIRQRLVAQLHEPVQWTRCVLALRAYQVTRVIECGPGRVLAGLIKRIDRGLHVESVSSPATLDHGLALARDAA